LVRSHVQWKDILFGSNGGFFQQPFSVVSSAAALKLVMQLRKWLDEQNIRLREISARRLGEVTMICAHVHDPASGVQTE
jgi:hypothetical protein